jgi:hypothetical protein
VHERLGPNSQVAKLRGSSQALSSPSVRPKRTEGESLLMLIPDGVFDGLNHTISQLEVVVVHVILAYFGIRHILMRPNQAIEVRNSKVEEIRQRLQKMSDEELLRYGQGCKYMCSTKVHFGKPPLEIWTSQLEEARAEWRRRHPKLPLNESV